MSHPADPNKGQKVNKQDFYASTEYRTPDQRKGDLLEEALIQSTHKGQKWKEEFEEIYGDSIFRIGVMGDTVECSEGVKSFISRLLSTIESEIEGKKQTPLGTVTSEFVQTRAYIDGYNHAISEIIQVIRSYRD